MCVGWVATPSSAASARIAVLRRADPLPADLDDVVGAGDRMVQQPPADAVARLEHDDRPARGLEVARGDEAGEARRR